MKSKPTVSQINIYPVKSLDGNSLQKAQISKGGCLLHDREYAIVNITNQFIIGKTNALVHTIRSSVNFETDVICFQRELETCWTEFHLKKERSAIDRYLSNHFGEEVGLIQNKEGRFMDMPDIAGLTVFSTASLLTVSTWFNDMDLEETRKRFRVTIEFEGVPAFWEDRLFLKEGMAIEFKIGDVRVMGISPRARCVVPTRHPDTGDEFHGFPKIFAQHRAAALPEWSTLEEFGHYYHLTVNCYLPPTEVGKWIQVGDEINILGEKSLPTSYVV